MSGFCCNNHCIRSEADCVIPVRAIRILMRILMSSVCRNNHWIWFGAECVVPVQARPPCASAIISCKFSLVWFHMMSHTSRLIWEHHLRGWLKLKCLFLIVFLLVLSISRQNKPKPRNLKAQRVWFLYFSSHLYIHLLQTNVHAENLKLNFLSHVKNPYQCNRVESYDV